MFGKLLIATCMAASAASAASVGAQQQQQPGERPTVVVVSFDAFADRFLDRDSLPNLHRLIAEGVRAPLKPEFPSKTFPNHYSMVTGLPPGQHGITTNTFFDPVRKEWFLKTSQADGSWFGGEPIWVTASRAGMRTGAYFWMGSEAEIKGQRPAFYKAFDATVPDSAKIVEMMQWLRLPAGQRPNLVLMYSPVVDVPGHRYGPDAPETRAGTGAADRAIGVLVDSLSKLPGRVDLIVVSDHGLSPVPKDHVIDMDNKFPAKGVLVDDEHATFSLWADPANPGVNMDSLAAFYRANLKNVRVFRPGEFPAEWNTEQNRRLGDIFLLANPTYEFVTTTPRAVYTAADHGYDPADPSMTGIFIARGPDFQRGQRLPARENRTLRDLLVQLLQLDAKPVAPSTLFGLRK